MFISFYNFFLVNSFEIPSYRIFKLYQGTFPESLRSLAQKMKEEIDFKIFALLVCASHKEHVVVTDFDRLYLKNYLEF